MAKKTVSDAKNSIQRILVGLDLDQTPDFYGALEQAVSTTIQKADIPEASGREPYMLYSQVYSYPAPDTIFGGAVIDFRPQGVTRNPWDEVSKYPIERFDRTKPFVVGGLTLTFEYRDGNPILRAAGFRSTPQENIDPMTDTDGWVAAGNASSLLKDTTVYYHAPAALRFNLAGGGTQGTLTKTLDNPLDLTNYEGVGVAFLAFDPPTASAFSTILLRLGSDASNYYEVSVTTGFVGAFYSDDYQLVAFDLANATTTGTPDIENIDYVQLIFNYVSATAIPNVRVGDLFISLPSPYEMLFYSPAVFQEAGAAASNTIMSDNDEILFRPAAYNIWVYEAARQVALDQGGSIASGLIASIDLVLEGNGDRKLGLYQGFRGDNPSEEIRQVGSYYESAFLNPWGNNSDND